MCYRALSITRAPFFNGTHNGHTIARPLGRGMVCLLWVQSLNYVLPLLLTRSLQYRVILDRDIPRVYCIIHIFKFTVSINYMCKHELSSANQIKSMPTNSARCLIFPPSGVLSLYEACALPSMIMAERGVQAFVIINLVLIKCMSSGSLSSRVSQRIGYFLFV